MVSLLTNRENEILKALAEGLRNKGIASKLSISESTVENHVHRIYEKLEISNRVQAVSYAYKSGIVPII